MSDDENFKERFRREWNAFHFHGQSADPNVSRLVSPHLHKMADMIESDRNLAAVDDEQKCESPIEVHFLRHYRTYAAGHEIEPQVKILRYRVDFLVNDHAVVECDGEQFHPLSNEKDAQRDWDMTQAGFKVFRFRGAEIMRDPFGCCRQVATYLEGL